MIKLYQFPPAWGLPNASGFCMKVETYLRMVGLPYEVVAGDLRKAPKGKLPYIEDDGRVVADSGFIIDYLKSTYGDPLDKDLTSEQKAVSLAFRRLLEENVYWAVVYSRWVEPVGWPITREVFFSSLPAPLRIPISTMARRTLIRELHGHGMGRHTREEIYAIGQADITALAEFLASKPYFLGEAPSSLDAVAFAFSANLLWTPYSGPLQDHARLYPQLEAYCIRMKARYFPDLA